VKSASSFTTLRGHRDPGLLVFSVRRTAAKGETKNLSLFWRFGVLAFWRFGVLAFWRFGVLAFWRFGG
jgi:hypothetical protein